MDDVAHFTIRPPLRCFGPDPSSASSICGEFAQWFRSGPTFDRTGFFCRFHRLSIDIKIPDEALFRRVHINAELLFAAVSWMPSIAHAEAVRLLNQGVGQVGGLVNLHTVSSAVGRWTPPAGRGG